MKKKVGVLTLTIKKRPQKGGGAARDVGDHQQLLQQLYQNQVSNIIFFLFILFTFFSVFQK